MMLYGDTTTQKEKTVITSEVIPLKFHGMVKRMESRLVQFQLTSRALIRQGQ